MAATRITSQDVKDGTLVDADIAAGAAIAYSKLSLTGSIVNADIAAAAAIAYSKLALTGSIVNADIAAAAAIATSKLADGTLFIKSDGTVPFGADQSHGGFKITSLGDPSAATDGANKRYVDSVASGLDVKQSVRASTTAALPSNTRTGNVLTATANGALSAQDGVTLVAADRVLVKNEATGANNGIYDVTTVGDGSNPFVLTRSTDADSSAEVTGGMFTFVNEGTLNADTGWVLSTNDPITLNTTSLSFTQFSSAGVVIFVDGETPSGTVDGVNDTFTLANTPTSGSVHVYKNGIRQRSGAGNDYTISGGTITFLAGNLPQTGDILLADYRR